MNTEPRWRLSRTNISNRPNEQPCDAIVRRTSYDTYNAKVSLYRSTTVKIRGENVARGRSVAYDVCSKKRRWWYARGRSSSKAARIETITTSRKIGIRTNRRRTDVVLYMRTIIVNRRVFTFGGNGRPAEAEWRRRVDCIIRFRGFLAVVCADSARVRN